MFRFFALALMLAVTVGLTGCGEGKSYDPGEYILELEYEDDFRILQLCDIHVGNKDDRQRQYDFLELTIEDADADLIVLCGDSFTFADKATAHDLFEFIDSHEIPWTITFGNHDEQCYFSVSWLTDFLNNYGSNCFFKDIQDDDVFGDSNFAINLKRDGKDLYQVILLDSNRYNYGEYIGYDYIHQDQIDWYEELVDYTTAQNGGEVVPSILFFHIPVPEFEDAWNALNSGNPDLSNPVALLEYGEINEGFSCPKKNSGFFDKVLEKGSSKAICVAHDHVNNLRMLYKGVILSYGINSTDRIYSLDEMTGGQVIVVHPDATLDFEAIYHTYGEVEK